MFRNCSKKKMMMMRKSISCSNDKQSIDEEDRPHWGLGDPPRSRRHPSSATAVSRTTSSASRVPLVVARRTKTKKVGREQQDRQQQTHHQHGLYRHRSSLFGYEDDDLAARAAASRQQRKFAFACQRSWAFTTDEEYEVRECICMDHPTYAAVLHVPLFFCWFFSSLVLFLLFLSSRRLLPNSRTYK